MSPEVLAIFDQEVVNDEVARSNEDWLAPFAWVLVKELQFQLRVFSCIVTQSFLIKSP